MTVVVFALLVVAPGPTPLQLSYVNSDSMAPTIAPDDGFLVWTWGSASVGDVVTFRSPERGELVTHRVVGTTDDGFLTRGDNNPSTDQSTGLAPVGEEQVVGTVVSVDGDPVLVPGLGGLVRFATTNRIGLLALLGAGLLGSALFGGREGDPERRVERTGGLLVVVLLAGAVAVVGLGVAGGELQRMEYVAVEDGTQSASTVPVGESRVETFVVDRPQTPLSRTVVDTRGMAVVDRQTNASAIRIDARVPPPTEPGPFTASIGVHRYVAVLPHSVLRTLDSVHPIVAAGATAVVLFVPLGVVALLLADRRMPLRSRRRPARGRRGP